MNVHVRFIGADAITIRICSMKSQVRYNAEKDPAYCPYCLRCRSIKRMVMIVAMLWECSDCSARHDEREA